MMPLLTASDAIAAYLAADDVVDWRDDGVCACAFRLTAGRVSDVDKARALFEYVRDEIPHSADVGREDVSCAASEVLRMGTGICYAKSHLLVALLRAVGIPSGFCYQWYEEPASVAPDQIALHGLVGIYLESLGRWVRVDPRGNKAGVDAQFSVDVERLAFPELAFLDDQIQARPLPGVVAALRTFGTCSALWSHLPGPPPGWQTRWAD